MITFIFAAKHLFKLFFNKKNSQIQRYWTVSIKWRTLYGVLRSFNIIILLTYRNYCMVHLRTCLERDRLSCWYTDVQNFYCFCEHFFSKKLDIFFFRCFGSPDLVAFGILLLISTNGLPDSLSPKKWAPYLFWND